MFLFLVTCRVTQFLTKFILHLQAFEDEMQNLVQGGGPVRASGAAETSSRKVPIRRLKSPRKSSVTSAPAGMSYFVNLKSWSCTFYRGPIIGKTWINQYSQQYFSNKPCSQEG